MNEQNKYHFNDIYLYIVLLIMQHLRVYIYCDGKEFSIVIFLGSR